MRPRRRICVTHRGRICVLGDAYAGSTELLNLLVQTQTVIHATISRSITYGDPGNLNMFHISWEGVLKYVHAIF